MKTRYNFFLYIAMASASLFLTTQNSSAEEGPTKIYWDAPSSGSTWSTLTSWTTDPTNVSLDPGSIPGASTIAAFSADSIAAHQIVRLSTAHSALGLSFSPSSFNHTLLSTDWNARSLTLGNWGIDLPDGAAGTTVTIGGDNPVNLSVFESQVWNVGTNRSLTIANGITGSASFRKTGTGILFLNGSGSFSGDFTHTQGTLAFGNVNSLGTTGGSINIAGGSIRNSWEGRLTLNNSKPVNVTGNFSFHSINGNQQNYLSLGNGPVTLAPNTGSTITFSSDQGVFAFDGEISGQGIGITKNGGGTLALLSSNNTYTGLTHLTTSANLRIGGPDSIANTNVFLNGGLLELGGPVVENTAFELGTNPGQIRFKSDATTTVSSSHGGFGSASGYRRISLTSEGVPNAPLIWGVTPHFMSAPAWGGGNGIFLLSTFSSAGTIDLTNDLDFGGLDRRFAIRDGTAYNMPDAVLSGKLTNGSLSLQGGGTVSITNPNNELSGTTLITAGTVLRVPQVAGYLGTSNVVIELGALEVSKNAVVTFGTGPGEVSFVKQENGGHAAGVSVYDGGGKVSLGSPTETITWDDTEFLGNGTFIIGSTAADGITGITNPFYLGSALRKVSVRNGGGYVDGAFEGVLSGPGGIHLIGAGGVLQMANPANTYTGATLVSSGAIAVDYLPNGGVPSNLGASSNDPSSLVFGGGGFRYNGPGANTDRLFEMRTSTTFNSCGTGPLVFSNTANNTFTAASGIHSLSMSGTARGLNVINSGITDGPLARTAIAKYAGTALWSMGGNNTYTGTTSVYAGELILDFSQGRNPAMNSERVGMDNSVITLKGKPSGVTEASFASLRFGLGPNGTGNVLRFDAPDTSEGFQLSVTNLGANTAIGNPLNSNLIDLSGHPGNTLRVENVTNGYGIRNGIIIATPTEDPTGGRTNLIVRDTEGFGFAKLSGPLPANVVPLRNDSTTTLTADNSDATGHFHLSYADLSPDSGDVPNGRKLTRTAALQYSTLSIDSSGDGPLHIDFGANDFGSAIGNNGRGVLITGNQDVKLTGTGITRYSPFYYHYGTGKFEVNLSTENGFSVIAGGTGLYEFSGPLKGNDARFYLSDCLFRFTAPTNLAALTNNASGFWVGNNAVIEIANDLNGSADGDFSNSVGNGAGQVRLTGNSGFSAVGGHRVVNFGGSGAQFSWGANYFITHSSGNDGDQMLRLSSPKSDSTIEIVNPISLNNRDRVIGVADGSAETDAVLSGAISGHTVGIIKRGPGTLALSGDNIYTGVTSVEEGTLRITKAYIADTSVVRVNPTDGAKLDLAHGQTDTVAALYIDGEKMPNGIYGASNLPSALSGSGKLNVGGVPSATTPYEDWIATNQLPNDKDEPEDDADGDGLNNLLEYAVGSDPKLPSGSILSKDTGNTGAVLFNRAANRTDITTVLETSNDLSPDSWVTVATSTAGAPFVTNDTDVVVTDSANPSGNSAVSVTDNRAPVPAKRFYRIRVEK
jgi:fibronectin-binding autotransporter adhesin